MSTGGRWRFASGSWWGSRLVKSSRSSDGLRTKAQGDTVGSEVEQGLLLLLWRKMLGERKLGPNKLRQWVRRAAGPGPDLAHPDPSCHGLSSSRG